SEPSLSVTRTLFKTAAALNYFPDSDLTLFLHRCARDAELPLAARRAAVAALGFREDGSCDIVGILTGCMHDFNGTLKERAALALLDRLAVPRLFTYPDDESLAESLRAAEADLFSLPPNGRAHSTSIKLFCALGNLAAEKSLAVARQQFCDSTF